MRRLQYTYTAIHQILTPLTINIEKTGLSHDLRESLQTLFPRKAPLFSQKSLSPVTIAFLPEAPFGPNANLLVDGFFPDFKKAVSEVKEYFELPDVEIICPKDPFVQDEMTWSKTLHKRHTRGILLSIFEFYKLHSAAVLGEQSNNMLMSIFVDPAHKFCLHVPQGVPIKEVFCHQQRNVADHVFPYRLYGCAG